MSVITASDGTSIYYRTWGRKDRPALLFLQGLGCDGNGWALQWPVLSLDFRCIVVDNRGVGRSEKPPGPYSLEQMARDGVAVLDAEGVAHAHVMGVSMGGVVSQLLSIKYPERVRSLVLAATSGQHHSWRIGLLARWQYLAVRYGMGKVSLAVAPYFVGERARRLLGRAAALAVRAVLPLDAQGFVSQLEAIMEVPDELRDNHRSVRVPTCVLVGDSDTLTPPADSRDLADRLPRGELHLIRNAGHSLIAEAPVQFNREVLRFLRQHAHAMPSA
jgi:3-oxoadipate enol-lactonase